HVHSIDETVICNWRASEWLNSSVGNEAQFVHRFVVEIGDRQRSKILVIIHSRWAIDHHGSHNSIPVLRSEMRVIPSRAVLGSLKLVSSGGSRWDGTLGDTRNTGMIISCYLIKQFTPGKTYPSSVHELT